MENIIIVNSLQETKVFSKEFAKEVKNGDVIEFLYTCDMGRDLT